MSRYSFEESIRDKATLPLHFEARLVELRVDKAAIDDAFAAITGHLTEEDQANLAKQAAKLAVLVKNPERVRTITADIVQHYQDKIEPNGFKAQIVTFDRESCVTYKQALDQMLPPEASEIVMSLAQGDPAGARQRSQQMKRSCSTASATRSIRSSSSSSPRGCSPVSTRRFCRRCISTSR
jgi:type I restriction enzyme R subunit